MNLDNTVIKTESPTSSRDRSADELYVEDTILPLADSKIGVSLDSLFCKFHPSPFTHLPFSMAGVVPNLNDVTDAEINGMEKDDLIRFALQAKTKILQLKVDVGQLEAQIEQVKADNRRRTPTMVRHENLELKQQQILQQVQQQVLQQQIFKLEADKTNLQRVNDCFQTSIDHLREDKQEYLSRELRLTEVLKTLRGDSINSTRNEQSINVEGEDSAQDSQAQNEDP